MSLAPRIAFIVACLGPVTGVMSAERAAAQNAPITIQHAFGETVLPQPPKRIATVAWPIRKCLWPLDRARRHGPRGIWR